MDALLVVTRNLRSDLKCDWLFKKKLGRGYGFHAERTFQSHRQFGQPAFVFNIQQAQRLLNADKWAFEMGQGGVWSKRADQNALFDSGVRLRRTPGQPMLLRSDTSDPKKLWLF
jgi:hypothetical protein